MPMQFLVADGNAWEGRAKHVAVCGRTSGELFAAILKGLADDLATTLVSPADAQAALPAGAALADFDGLVLTGSSLRVGEGTPAVTRQCDLVRAALEAGVPVFGSCWGVQVAALVAGGEAARNPHGPEYGVARRIVPLPPGRDHPLLAGRPEAYDAPAIHLDAVLRPPPDSTVLAANALLDVQAIEIRHGGGTFWGTQYHPELDLDEVGAMLRLSVDAVVEAGLCPDPAAVGAYADDLVALHRETAAHAGLAWRYGLDAEVLERACRRREIANFIDGLVRPTRRARGRD